MHVLGLIQLWQLTTIWASIACVSWTQEQVSNTIDSFWPRFEMVE